MIKEKKFKVEDFHLVCGYIQGRLSMSNVFEVGEPAEGYKNGFQVKIKNITFRVFVEIINDNFQFKELVMIGSTFRYVYLRGKPLSYLLEKIQEILHEN